MKADIVALAQVFGVDGGLSSQLDAYYDQAIKLLGDAEVIVQASFIPLTAGTAVYPWPEDTVRSLAGFFNEGELTQTTLAALDEDDRGWHADEGTPAMYVELHEHHHTVRLYPAPDTTSAAWVPLNGEPFGIDYPTDQFVLFTVNHIDAAPVWLDLPLALHIAAQEFDRPSAHQDHNWASLCAQMAAFLRAYGGVP